MGDRCYEHGTDDCLGCVRELRARAEKAEALVRRALDGYLDICRTDFDWELWVDDAEAILSRDEYKNFRSTLERTTDE